MCSNGEREDTVYLYMQIVVLGSGGNSWATYIEASGDVETCNLLLMFSSK
jgi:hypothetical protein